MSWQEQFPNEIYMMVPDWYVAVRRATTDEQTLHSIVREHCLLALNDTHIDEAALQNLTLQMIQLYQMAYRAERFGHA